jgi:predicted metal-dependent hydrolase
MVLFPYQFDPSPEEIEAACIGELHPQAIKGIELFNLRDYWLAHEALETAWMEEHGIIRALYKGILQSGVMYLQIQRNNLVGAMKMHKRCHVWLDPWPQICRGVNVARLIADIDNAANKAANLGVGNLEGFDPSLFQPIEWTP